MDQLNKEIFFFDIKMSTDDKLDVVTEVTFPARTETIAGKERFSTLNGSEMVSGSRYKVLVVKGKPSELTSFEKEYLKAHLSNLLDLE